jgi:hypothetical protein
MYVSPVELLQTLMGLEHTPLHTAARRPQHDGGTPAVLRVRVGERAPVVRQNYAAALHSAGGSHSSAQGASQYTHTHR